MQFQAWNSRDFFGNRTAHGQGKAATGEIAAGEGEGKRKV